MDEQSVEEAVFTACVVDPRDFTDVEKQYVLNCASESGDRYSNFRAELVFWFESKLSDGY